MATKGSGHTEPGSEYKARWKDEHGNMSMRLIPRPDIISKYFSASNVIDMHNHARQYMLRLEKHWVTNDGYFRMITSVIAMCITDAWKAYKHHLGSKHRHKMIAIEDFVDILCLDCLENNFSSSAGDQGCKYIPPLKNPDKNVIVLDNDDLPSSLSDNDIQKGEPKLITSSDLGSSSSSSSSLPITETHDINEKLSKIAHKHFAVKGKEKVVANADGKKYERTKRGKCFVCYKRNGKRLNTSYYCGVCEKPMCVGDGHDLSQCEIDHIAEVYCMLVANDEAGTKKKKKKVPSTLVMEEY